MCVYGGGGCLGLIVAGERGGGCRGPWKCIAIVVNLWHWGQIIIWESKEGAKWGGGRWGHCGRRLGKVEWVGCYGWSS